VIVRPELLEKILAGETEAARILEPGNAGSVRRYRSRWQEANRAAWASTTRAKPPAIAPFSKPS
jgi:hypothetical protein